MVYIVGHGGKVTPSDRYVIPAQCCDENTQQYHIWQMIYDG